MVLQVVPEGLAAASAAVEAITAALAAAHAAAAPVISAVAPPAVDPVSVQAAAELGIQGSQHTAVATHGTGVLGGAGAGVAQAGLNYQGADALAASAFSG
ncbi:PE domain-containing protein [Mycolicibacter sp. MYC123]|uniref:PE domain-containing protein n=1 Tax=[Mycobacterium] zoologicum TaxID=2872311 RepID=A0ABU5YJC0_9MYCO|nr:PE domain-containing protein [Mycolicibacter sp. MYC123]MEB3050133.1 PE domain-containing protein [Mycolicibacter sp. MYC123]